MAHPATFITKSIKGTYPPIKILQKPIFFIYILVVHHLKNAQFKFDVKIQQFNFKRVFLKARFLKLAEVLTKKSNRQM